MKQETTQNAHNRITTDEPMDWSEMTDWQLDRWLNSCQEQLAGYTAGRGSNAGFGILSAWKGEIKAEIAKRNNYIIR